MLEMILEMLEAFEVEFEDGVVAVRFDGDAAEWRALQEVEVVLSEMAEREEIEFEGEWRTYYFEGFEVFVEMGMKD